MSQAFSTAGVLDPAECATRGELEQIDVFMPCAMSLTAVLQLTSCGAFRQSLSATVTVLGNRCHLSGTLDILE